jgi:hypothetical protein
MDPAIHRELTKIVLESGVLDETQDAFVVEDQPPNLAIPASPHDSPDGPADWLPPCKEVAQIAACIGREFSYRLLTAIMPSPAGAGPSLARLVEAELIFSLGAPRKATTRSSTLVRDAAYESLLRPSASDPRTARECSGSVA